MRVTILGSGTNLHPRRAAAGYLVETDHTILLDFGPRTLTNLLKTGTDRHRLTHILFSHFHADHVADFITFFFDAVIQEKFGGRRPDLTLIGPRGAKRVLGSIFKTFPSFDDHAFHVSIEEVRDRPFSIGRTLVYPRPMVHTQSLHAVGYRLEHDGACLTYSGDAQYSASLVELAEAADVSILDCSFPANRPGINHMHAGECGRVAREAAVGRLVLSHFYPIAERFDVRGQAARMYSGRIDKARDLMRIRM
jgi:ribonuclease BN (tRNA processing enzyme)